MAEVLEICSSFQYNQIVAKMQGIYGSGKVCPYENQKCDLEKEGLTLEPGLEAIMSDLENSSYQKLTYVWEQWRKASGFKYREDYIKYININNEAAAANSKIHVKNKVTYSDCRHTANSPTSLIEERFSETGSKILPFTDFLNQRLVLKLYQFTSCRSHLI